MAVKQRFSPPRRCRINTSPNPDIMGRGFYHGLILWASGIDMDDLIAIELPEMGDRLPYMGRFKPEYIEFLEPENGHIC
jgi:hypothetical protein